VKCRQRERIAPLHQQGRAAQTARQAGLSHARSAQAGVAEGVLFGVVHHGGKRGVANADGPGGQKPRNGQRFVRAARNDRGAESVLGICRQFGGVREIAAGHDGQQRAEAFLAHDEHFVIRAGQQCGAQPQAAAQMLNFAAAQNRGAARAGVGNVRFQNARLPLPNKRVRRLPVKQTASAREISAAPVSPSPATTSSTSAKRGTARMLWRSGSMKRGVTSLGFTMTAQPATSAGSASSSASSSGKFHGVMLATSG